MMKKLQSFAEMEHLEIRSIGGNKVQIPSIHKLEMQIEHLEKKWIMTISC